MSRLFNVKGVAGFSDEGVVLWRAIWNYLYFVYSDAREMGIPLHEITSIILRVAVALDNQFVSSAQKEINEYVKAQLPDDLKMTTGYTRQDVEKRDNEEGPVGPADILA